MNYSFAIAIFLLLAGCRERTKQDPAVTPPILKTVTIKILPLGKANAAFVRTTLSRISPIVKNVVLLPTESMPAAAYYAPRKRYRADSLIHWMSRRAGSKEVYLGITQEDISTTKGDNPDYGVMGLGFEPGNACMASDFRLRKKTDFFKVVLHELGHTAGLPHCPEKSCFMRDAEGHDPTGEETGFCAKCKNVLLGIGWKL